MDGKNVIFYLRSHFILFSAVTVRFLTKRFIGEYNSDVGKSTQYTPIFCY